MVKAFEPERRLSWHTDGWLDIKQFQTDIESETLHARGRFKFPGAHLENDSHSKSYWISILTEEIGKLCQCVNKLQIAQDESIRKTWGLEGYHRIITTSSLLRRMAQQWANLPDH